jgi:hypothetical protein
MLIVVAPALIAASTQRHRKSISVRVPSSADHSTSSTWLRARVTWRSTISKTCSGSFCSLYFMCTGEVDRKVWMRPRFACFTASAQRSMSLQGRARQAAITAFLGPLGDLAHRLEVAVGGDRETGFDDIDAHARRAVSATSSFSSKVMVAPGHCSPSRSVVSKIRRGPDWTGEAGSSSQGFLENRCAVWRASGFGEGRQPIP